MISASPAKRASRRSIGNSKLSGNSLLRSRRLAPGNSYYFIIVIAWGGGGKPSLFPMCCHHIYHVLSRRTAYGKALSRKMFHLDVQPYSEDHANHDREGTCGQRASGYLDCTHGIQSHWTPPKLFVPAALPNAACAKDKSGRLSSPGACFDSSIARAQIHRIQEDR